MRRELWPQGQVLPHDLPLVVLADMHWYIIENTRDPAAPVENDRQELISFVLKVGTCRLVFQLVLMTEFVDMQILVFVWIPRDEAAVLAAEECHVHHNNDRPWTVHFLRDDNRIKSFGDRACAHASPRC